MTTSPWGLTKGQIMAIFAKAKAGRPTVRSSELSCGDLVMRRDGPEFVGRVMKIRTRGPFGNGKVEIKVKPIHAVEGRNQKKGHWCSINQWRKVSPLEMLSLQAEKS